MRHDLVSWFFDDCSPCNKLLGFAEGLASIQSMTEGCALVERIHLPHLVRGHSLCRAVSMIVLMTCVGSWQKRYGMRVEVEPVSDDQELGQETPQRGLDRSSPATSCFQPVEST